MNKLFVSLLILPVVVGCSANATNTARDPTLIKEPNTLPELLSRLKPMIFEIHEAIMKGDPTASDEELHDAMFLANRIPRLLGESSDDNADNSASTTVDEDAEHLFQLLMTAHNAAHGSELTVEDEVVTDGELAKEILITFQRLEAAMD